MSASPKSPASTGTTSRRTVKLDRAGKNQTKKQPQTPARESRGERRKREARTRLLDAAFQLMAVRGVDSVAIQEITEAADVATGGFYNHFKSKEDIYLEVTRRVFDDFAMEVEKLVEPLDDPAEVIAINIRQTLLRARREPLWGEFLLRDGHSGRTLTRGLGKRMWQDITRGIESGRFTTRDRKVAYLVAGGAVLAAVASLVRANNADPDLGERIAAAVLQVLGLGSSQAKRIATKPMPAR